MQAAIDRTLSEQQALVRSHSILVRSLMQWSDIYERVDAVVEGFGDDIRAVTSAYLQEISVLEGSLRSVVDALNQAESGRIDDPKSGARINPLDALSRGVLGSDTGHLINSLRMQEPNLRQIMIKLADLRSAVAGALEVEKAKWRSDVRDRLKLSSNKSTAIASSPVPIVSRAHSDRNFYGAGGGRRQTTKTPQKNSPFSNDSNARPPWSSS